MTTRRLLGLLIATTLASHSAISADPAQNTSLRAVLSTQRRDVNVGEPIWVDFTIENRLDEPVTLFVHGTEPQVGTDPVGLPLSHIFSGTAFGALTVRNEANRTWNIATSYQPPSASPVITLAPHSIIGRSINIREYYAALGTPGDYRIKWAPYEGAIESNTLLIRVATLKQAEILTDHGTMTVRFFYEDAPNHVQNFIELAKKGFYDGLTFHRIESGYFIQGGCPNGDGTGIRPDGIKLKAEISDRPQTKGLVNMALADDDPDSGSCQFFITYTRVPEWDGKYSTLGTLQGDASFATLDELMKTPIDDRGLPKTKIAIRAIRIVDIPRE